MKTFFVLICSCTIVGAASGATQAKTFQHAATHSAQPASNSVHVQRVQAPQHVVFPGGHPPGVPSAEHRAGVPFGGRPAHIGQPPHPQLQGGGPQTATAVQPAARPLTKEQQVEVYAQDQGFRSAEQYRKWKETGRVETPESVAMTHAPTGDGMTAAGSGAAAGLHKGVHEFPSRHFDLPKTPMPGIENVKFQSGSHIPECEKLRDSRYNVFRNYTATWHDADWWRSHHSRIVFVCRGWYYWHAGYWFPAWGY